MSVLYLINLFLAFLFASLLTILLIPRKFKFISKIQNLVIDKTHEIAKKKYISLTILVIVCILLFESLYSLTKVQTQKKDAGNELSFEAKLAFNATLFKSQRNVYITVFNVFLIFVHWGVGNLIRQLKKED